MDALGLIVAALFCVAVVLTLVRDHQDFNK